VTSLAASTASLRNASSLFLAGYEPTRWTGFVTAFSVDAGTGIASATGLWGTVPASDSRPAEPASTATFLDSSALDPADRLVLSATASDVVAGVHIGIPFTWDSLSADQKKALDTRDGLDDGLGKPRLAYLRGDHAMEQSNGGVFRNRVSRHGDIVNSKLWYLTGAPGSGYSANGYADFKARLSPRDAMLYVGANDGMLHGFSATTGQEKIAYIPLGDYAQLPGLTSASYAHRYFVDGSPFTADVHGDGSWKTYLAGFLGLGGKGYFVLDVTEPAAFHANDAARLMVLDQTGSTDADIGHITSEPVLEHHNSALTRQITQLNDGRWALVTGNGYNSTTETATLLIQYLDQHRELIKIRAVGAAVSGAETGNGLSAPRLIDLNGDKVPDIAYAGDLLGNVWKFDISSGDAKAWSVAFDGKPLYVAQTAGSSGTTQPVTSAPAWLAHPLGGIMLVFGTGRLLTDADRADTSRQTIYGVYDDTVVTRDAGKVTLIVRSGPVSAGRSALVRQEIDPDSTATGATGALWTVSSRPVSFTGADPKQGWYLDLPAGERVLGNPGWFGGSLVDIPSTVPATGKTWSTTLNAINGNAPKSQIYAYEKADTPSEHSAESQAGTASRTEMGLRVTLTNPSDRREKGLCAPGQNCPDRTLLPSTALRPSWRQLQ